MEHDVVYMEKGDDGIAVISFNQPKKKNAINARMMDLLTECLEEADLDSGIRVVVLRGAGDNFTSGGDLSQSSPEENTPENARKTYRHYVKALVALRSCSKPVIAMVDGYAVGGGFAFILASDLVCISESAVIIPAFCQIGIAPELGVTKFLPELVGHQRAKEIIFLGERLSGGDLARMGIANRLCASADLEAVTMELAHKLSAMPDASIQVAKTMINSLCDTDLQIALSAEQTASPFCTTTKAYEQTAAKFAKK